MSAIFGVLGTVSPLELDEMGRRLSHRGSVAQWQQVSRNVFLGQVGSGSSQPEVGTSVICVIDASSQDHCATVRAALGQKNPISALEVEPNLPFAFAAYSEEDDCLILGRDYFGLKPLHFCRLPSGGIAFATEYKALLALNEVEAVADLESIEHLQRYKAVPAGRTLLKGIAPVPPGSAAYFERTGDIRHVHRMPEIRMNVRKMDEETACKLVRDKLLDATARLVSGSSRIAVALSGGIDSLSVAAMARAVAPQADLIAFTAGECPEDPEIHRAAHAMSHLKGQHETLFVSTEELMARLPLAVWHLENPIGRSETFQYLAIAKRARECGVDSLLTGMGADLLFGGMPRHKVLWMAEVMPQLRNSLLAFFTSTQTGEPPKPWLARCMMQMYYRGGLAMPPRVLGSGHVEEPELIAGAGSEFLNRCLMLDGQEPTSRTLARIERPLQAFGIEYTSPYLDTSIVDFAFTIPGHLKIKQGTQKYILRKAMQPLVGERLYKAPKALMRMKQNSDFANALDSLAARYLSSDRVRRRGFFDEQDVSRIRAAARRGNHPENVMRLWTMLVTEIWAEIYLDGRGRHPMGATSVPTTATEWSAVGAPALV